MPSQRQMRAKMEAESNARIAARKPGGGAAAKNLADSVSRAADANKPVAKPTPTPSVQSKKPTGFGKTFKEHTEKIDKYSGFD